MSAYEYKVVPAPARGQKARGVKGHDGRFAHAIEAVMNQMALDGWEYQRSETLPSEERSGLTSTTTTYRNILVFRRRRGDDVAAFQPRTLDSSLDNATIAKLPPPAAAPVVTPVVTQAEAPPADDDPFMMAELPDTATGKVLALPVALLARAKSQPAPPPPDPEDVAAE